MKILKNKNRKGGFIPPFLCTEDRHLFRCFFLQTIAGTPARNSDFSKIGIFRKTISGIKRRNT
ncbi:hypothetical protein CH375_06655 [Leptospira ellisii]|uniref:Uncharacterized protein n=1 Tax=Leptospira ellisii TaxID=2023197 RepID=A0A2N0B610_9LEPT|nr:hypothetical protein CH379_15590 [Leptospira ellisii]PKA05177.1 hypothetical protein CH375_06655 [Leptospira ellisii]